MTTIADVAKYTGLSRATVSRVINNYPHVSEQKRELVRQAMMELGYYPNSAAQSLRNQKTGIVAVLVPRLTNPFFTSIIEGLEVIAEKNNLQLLICQTKASKQKELSFLKLLKTKQVDGLIFTAIENEWSKIEPYVDCGPIILCNEYQDDATVPMIKLDQYNGSYMGTKHLIERGYKKIAFCGGGSESGLSLDRKKGFLAALSEAGIKGEDKWMFPFVYNIGDGKKVMKEILAMDDRPTAVFTSSDEVAAGIIKEAKDNNLTVPEDIAVIGFDDQAIAQIIEPEMTTIYQPSEEIGRVTMEVMIELLNNKAQSKMKMIYELPINLVIRKST
ncbi:LacI family DNA-binding transcriptional regulator [Pseudalkalibacillus caeni]|uniref:LacI family transcriptional regulator n=1 Tax=Exobacillus caeni TaxID=2574798 RepID=A0A5R9FB17_9BACL|nr:LacI family DNA-binding transcriptional regulator [Pseudalkalibacillus caeni]TLS38848.1 LacI family transcriptional regulator [Pseudalkalibacillus caeni]